MINPATLPAPLTRAVWETQREDIRRRWWDMLGELPPLFTPQPTPLERTMREGCVVERFVFDNGANAKVYGYLLLPPNQSAPAPAVLYLHGHGFKYEIGKDDIFRERIPATMPGPADDAESGAAVELALFKHFLWQGRRCGA